VETCIVVEQMGGGLGMLPCLDRRENVNVNGSVDCGYGGGMLMPVSRVRRGGRSEERLWGCGSGLFVLAWLLSGSCSRVRTFGILALECC
jgi:hypothetical protein